MIELGDTLALVTLLTPAAVLYAKPGVDTYKLYDPAAPAWVFPVLAILLGIVFMFILLMAAGYIFANIPEARLGALVVLTGYQAGLQAVGVQSLGTKSNDSRQEALRSAQQPPAATQELNG